MSEPTTETTVEPQAAATEPVGETAPDLGDAGKAAIDRMKAERDNARREAKANADAAKRLAELEDAQKSEAQRLTDRQAQAERERDEARAEGLRYKAAIKYGVDEDNFDLLGTGAEEEIAARAERVGGLLKLAAENEQLKAENEALKQGKAAPGTTRPVASLASGASPAETPALGEAEYPAHWFPKVQRGS